MLNLRFNTRIYKEKALREAMADYSSLAKFRARQAKYYTEVKITNVDPALKSLIADEFSNYVLAKTRKCL